MGTLIVLLRRAKQIFQTERLTPLVRSAFAFMVRRLFRHETYYLHEFEIKYIAKLNEADFMPNIDNFTFKIISTNQQADELEAQGLEFRSQIANARKMLDKGAIAYCIFVGRELANIGWAAMSEEAKKLIDLLPYKVDFSANEVCEGGVWTNPKYRQRGLHGYNDFKRRQFQLERGLVIGRGAIRKGNIASLRGNARFNPKIYAEGRYLKILWWKWWKEKPLA